MNTLDIVILVPLVYGFYKGYKKGLVFEVLSLVSLFAGIYLSIKFSFVLEDYLVGESIIDSKYAGIISFVLMFVGILALVHLIGKLLEKILKKVSLEFLNKAAGGIFGTTKFFLVVSILLYLLQRIEEYFLIIPLKTKESSVLYGIATQVTNTILPEVIARI